MGFPWFNFGGKANALNNDVGHRVAESVTVGEFGKASGIGIVKDGSKCPEKLTDLGMNADQFKRGMEQMGFTEFVIQTNRGGFHIPEDMRRKAVKFEGQTVHFEGAWDAEKMSAVTSLKLAR